MRAFLRACKTGLADHPLVREFIGVCRAFGQRKTLRRPRIGLEKGVWPPLSPQEVGTLHAYAQAEREAQRRAEAKGGLPRVQLTRLQRKLEARKVITRRKSRQAFHKDLARLGLSAERD